MPKPYWMQFADLGLIRLNQAADDNAGGAADEDDEDDDGADDAAGKSGDAGGDTDDDADEDPKTLEDALAALKKARSDSVAVQRVRRNLDRRTKKDQKTIEQLEAQLAGAGKGGGGGENAGKVDADALRAEVRAELAVENGVRLATAEAKALLTGKVNIKPEKAVVLLGDALKESVGDDGELDVQAIADAVEELLEDNPGLQAARGAIGVGDADQGFRGGGPRQSEEQQLVEQLAAADKAGDHAKSIGIKQRLAAIRAAKKKG